MSISIGLDGLTVHLYRSELDNELVVDIDSSGLEDDDQIVDTAEPKIRIYVNEARILDHGEAVPEEEWGQ